MIDGHIIGMHFFKWIKFFSSLHMYMCHFIFHHFHIVNIKKVIAHVL